MNSPISPKWLTIDTSRQSSNYVKVGTGLTTSKQHQFTPKANNKIQQNVFKSNFMSRYSSQQDLQSHVKPKYSIEDFKNSPKNQPELMFKKNVFIPRKSNEIMSREIINSQIGQGKKQTYFMQSEYNPSFFKAPTIQSKKFKQLKETSSTSSTDNFAYGKSQKTIPSFLKNVTQNKRRPQEIPEIKKKNLFFKKIQGELSIDNFFIVFKLGEGKFGTVFLAIQRYTGFLIALKVIEKKRVIQENFLVQFIREIKIQAFLDHPNIAKVFGFFHDQQNFYSILELGQGGQLFDIIKNGQTLSQQSTSFIIGNLLDAVTYMHDHKILHRDIKPQNIVLVHGNVKLCDFGWAVYKKGQLRSTFCGTPLYLSPQLLNGQKYDEKVDLWAIGILAFELHLGSSPFNIQSQEDLLKIITDQIEYPQDCYASKHFKQFIGAVLRKDPKQRLQAKKLMGLKFIRKYRQLQTCQQLCQ